MFPKNSPESRYKIFRGTRFLSWWINRHLWVLLKETQGYVSRARQVKRHLVWEIDMEPILVIDMELSSITCVRGIDQCSRFHFNIKES